MKPYSFLAAYYDKFSQNDCDYSGWWQYLRAIARKRGAKTVADLACGTGKITKFFCDDGFSVVGVDESSEMLNQAAQKCRATFVCQNIKNLRLPRPVDMAVAVNDAVNYLKPTELAEFFSAVAANLKEGAPFVFDISSAYKLIDIVGNNVFFVDEEEATLLWSNKLSARAENVAKQGFQPRRKEVSCNDEHCEIFDICSKNAQYPLEQSVAENSAKVAFERELAVFDHVTMSLTLFERRGESYRRFDETHVQYVHSQQSVTEALKTCGFEIREISADYGKQLQSDSLRITFYTTKLGDGKNSAE